MALYDNLFEPIQVGSVTIKNRIVRSPHGTGLSGEPGLKPGGRKVAHTRAMPSGSRSMCT